MTRLRKGVALVPLAVTLAITCAALVAAAPAPAALPRACPRISGPAVQHDGRTVTQYVIGAHGGVTCAFAKTWVAKVLRESTPTSTIARPTGPAGWNCIANAKQHIAFNGACRNGLKSFSWGAL